VVVVTAFVVAGGENGVGDGGEGGYDASAMSYWNHYQASVNQPSICPVAKCLENLSWTLPNR